VTEISRSRHYLTLTISETVRDTDIWNTSNRDLHTPYSRVEMPQWMPSSVALFHSKLWRQTIISRLYPTCPSHLISAHKNMCGNLTTIFDELVVKGEQARQRCHHMLCCNVDARRNIPLCRDCSETLVHPCQFGSLKESFHLLEAL